VFTFFRKRAEEALADNPVGRTSTYNAAYFRVSFKHMRITRKHKTAFSGICIAVVITAVVLSFVGARQSSSEGTPPDGMTPTVRCSNEFSVMALSTNNTLSGLADVVVTIPTGCQIGKVTVFATTSTAIPPRAIGSALSGAALYSWTYRWDTTSWPNGIAILSANVYITGSASPISAKSIIVNVYNTPITSPEPDTTPISPNITPDTKPPLADTNPETTATSPTTEPVAQITSATAQNSPITQSCIEAIITKARYDAINSGASRPTDIELAKIQSCFATANYILPTEFSPIEPTTAKSLQQEKTITVSKLENVNRKDAYGNKKETLKISGTAKPNSLVFLYIFSDPLVITTSTDSDGNWQYVLEDPLKPGEHEVYAVVDKGDGSYRRSDPLAFIISTAGATAVNPDGLSLNLSEPPTATPAESTRSLVFYIAGSVAVLAIVLTGLYLFIRSRRKKEAKPTDTIDNSPQEEPADLGINQVDIGDTNSELASNYTDANPQSSSEDNPIVNDSPNNNSGTNEG
jgi:hypothetical protein